MRTDKRSVSQLFVPLLAVLVSTEMCAQSPFVTTWKTDNPGISNITSITIPTVSGETYDYEVDWTYDGITFNVDAANVSGNIMHDYGVPDTFTVAIRGVFPRIFFNDTNDEEKILTVEQWGGNSWSSMEDAFKGCHNLEVNATDIPDLSNVTSMKEMFDRCFVMTGNATFNSWNVGSVTDMNSLFEDCYVFNQNIGAWDVSEVTDMYDLFSLAYIFNQDISTWDVSKVEDMGYMFEEANAFNQNIGNWDVSAVLSMGNMFNDNDGFNQDIGAWDVSKVTKVAGMFSGSDVFDQDIGAWDVGQVTNMNVMFRNATAFDQDLSNWDVSKVEYLSRMFGNATAFDQDLGSWDITSVLYAFDMFDGAGLSNSNYDALLIGWSTDNSGVSMDGIDDIPQGINFSGGNSTYCNGANARAELDITHTWNIVDSGATCSTINYFVSSWKTDNPGISNATSIAIPTESIAHYNYDVDWTYDGLTFNADDSGVSGGITHDYSVAGTYIVAIRGTFPQIDFRGSVDDRKILSIQQWGTIPWASMEGAFYGCENLDFLTATAGIPDLSSVTNMESMFEGCNSLTGDVTAWDISNVTSLNATFYDCTLFNQDVSAWDVSNVSDFGYLFSYCPLFNQDISGWDMSSATSLYYMFYEASIFNQPIGAWDVSNVTDMEGVFADALAFDQALDSWDVSSVITMDELFYDAASFNQDLNAWDVSKVEDMDDVFLYAYVFNGDISAWDVSSATTMDHMFGSAYAFDRDISNWDVSGVSNMEDMFSRAYAFNQDISNWNVSSVTNMSYMFRDAHTFNKDLSLWDVSNVKGMQHMFQSAESFNQSLGAWDISSITSSGFNNDMDYMFSGAGISTENYDSTLIAWERLDPGETQIPTGVTFSGGYSNYCAGADARDSLTMNYGWNINDQGPDPFCESRQFQMKVFLQGPFDGVLMHDSLREQDLIPNTEPYTGLGWAHLGDGGGEYRVGNLFDVSGADAVVDWILIQLRDKSDNTQVLSTRCALVQRDGDVVFGTGTLGVPFTLPADDYYIAVFHRNHLGTMTLGPVAISDTPVLVDFTDGSTPVYGTNAQADVSGVKVLWGGDVFSDGIIKYVGADNDRDPVLVEIGGSVPTHTVSGYSQSDVTMDGIIKYIGANNDRDPILVNVGGSVPTSTRVEQIP